MIKLDVSLTGVGTREAAEQALVAEATGFAGVWATESVTDALLMAMGAALSTQRVDISTAIAVAFARNPMLTAYGAWDLCAASQGRFALGLGTQVQAHIQRRFAMPWSDPVERLLDFVGAIRSIWRTWQDGDRLAYEGPYYRHTLMTPMFTPLHHDYPLRVYASAVGPNMTAAVVEHLDGLIGHCFTTPVHFDRTVTSQLGSRALAQPLMVYCPLMLLVADTDEEMTHMRATARKQIAFYGSTAEYRGVLDSVGYGGLQPELRALSRRGEWDEMSLLIDDELIDALTISGQPEQIPGRVFDRWHGRLDRVSSIFGWPASVDQDRLRAIIDEFDRSDAAEPAG